MAALPEAHGLEDSDVESQEQLSLNSFERPSPSAAPRASLRRKLLGVAFESPRGEAVEAAVAEAPSAAPTSPAGEESTAADFKGEQRRYADEEDELEVFFAKRATQPSQKARKKKKFKSKSAPGDSETGARTPPAARARGVLAPLARS